MSDEEGLVAPLERDVLALGDLAEVDLDFGQGQNVSGSREGRDEVGDDGFGAVGCPHAAGWWRETRFSCMGQKEALNTQGWC